MIFHKWLKFINNNNLNYLNNITYAVKNIRFSSSRNSTIKYENLNSSSSNGSCNRNNLFSLQNKIENRIKPFSVTEWKNIRSELITTERNINDVNVDATILGLCNSSSHLDIAKSYISFLKSEGLELNDASLGRLMKIFYLVYKSGQITDTDRKDILEIYNTILKRHKILDSVTCENLIHGIIATDQWKNSLDLLNMIELTCKPSTSAYSTIITRAFEKNCDEDIAWKLLREMITNNKQPKCEIFLTYLKRIAEDKTTFKYNVERMLEFLEENEIIISRLVAEEMHFVLQQFRIHSTITTLSRNGKCNSCRVNLKKVSLSNEEFHKLSSEFLDKVLIRKDVFLKSLPGEVDSFVKFIDQTAPYDCVIDGLNVAFSQGNRKNPVVYAKLVASVVKYFVQRNKKVLVIGRDHMKKWAKEPMKYIKDNSFLFLTTNLSQDDPFLLYAALKSGPRTDFLSCDLMRSHAFLLGQDLKPIFRRWQIEHQYSILKTNEYGRVTVKEPIKHYLTVHKIDSTWHVPFREMYMANPSDQYEVHQNWLCLSF